MRRFFGPSGAEKEQEARDYLLRFLMMQDVTASSLGFTNLNEEQDKEFGVRLQLAIIDNAGLKPYILHMIAKDKFENTKRMIEVAGRLKKAEDKCIFLPTTPYTGVKDYHSWRNIPGNHLLSLRELKKTSRGLESRDDYLLTSLENDNRTARKEITAIINSRLLKLQESKKSMPASKIKPKPKGKGLKY